MPTGLLCEQYGNDRLIEWWQCQVWVPIKPSEMWHSHWNRRSQQVKWRNKEACFALAIQHSCIKLIKFSYFRLGKTLHFKSQSPNERQDSIFHQCKALKYYVYVIRDWSLSLTEWFQVWCKRWLMSCCIIRFRFHFHVNVEKRVHSWKRLTKYLAGDLWREAERGCVTKLERDEITRWTEAEREEKERKKKSIHKKSLPKKSITGCVPFAQLYRVGFVWNACTPLLLFTCKPTMHEKCIAPEWW